MFCISAVAIGFLYIASQAVASATAGKTHNERTNIRYWFKVEAIELTFCLFALAAVLHFVVNAGGGSRIKHWYGFVLAMLTISFILVGVAPDVYRQFSNTTEFVKYDRGGCHASKELDVTFKLVKTCPLLPTEGFLRFDFDNRTEEEARATTTGLEVLNNLATANILARGVKQTKRPELESFMEQKCAYAMIDATCAELFREVQNSSLL